MASLKAGLLLSPWTSALLVVASAPSKNASNHSCYGGNFLAKTSPAYVVVRGVNRRSAYSNDANVAAQAGKARRSAGLRPL
jgi:hypothetical protein